MPSYYDKNKATVANAADLICENEEQHFPHEGLFLGNLTGGQIDIPALFDLNEGKGLCRLIERQSSGSVLKNLVDDVNNECAAPTILAIIGSERFIEMKRKMPLEREVKSVLNGTDDEVDFNMSGFDLSLDITDKVDSSNMTYPQALMYILDEGPMQDVHVLLQFDKPQNILFGDEYDVEAALKFRHKVILRSENKFLNSFRFSQDIDVESLSDEEEHLRAYYYPDGDDPVLFAPYQMPDSEII